MSQKKTQLFNPLNGNINVTGVVTASSFSGDGSGLTGVASTDNIQTATDATFLANVNITGITTASGGFVGGLTGNATGLSGSPDITVTNVTGAAATFSGNVTIGGTLTYQDVENIDSVGIITAQQGIQVLANGLDVTGVGTFNTSATFAGITTADATGVNVTGVITATSFVGDGSGLENAGASAAKSSGIANFLGR